MSGYLCLLFLIYLRPHVIAFGFGGPSEKNAKSSLIFYCKIPILCQSLAKFHQICRSCLRNSCELSNLTKNKSQLAYYIIEPIYLYNSAIIRLGRIDC